MEKEQAIEVLIQVAKIAQSKGLFTLEDANTVLQAISVLNPKKEEEV